MKGSGSKALLRSLAGIGIAVTVAGCAFQGWNSIPLPGAVGRGPGAAVYHVQVADVGTMESNSPVMIDDVIVGSIGKMTVRDWRADVEISVKPEVVVPVNAVATVGQTSLLGSMHLSLNPPIGESPVGRLEPGATIPLARSATYPSTEQTLAALSAVVNGGGLGQIGDIIHNFNAAMGGREDAIRDLLSQADIFVATLDRQSDALVASIRELDRLAGQLVGQRDVIKHALQRIPEAVDVLIRERPNFTTALDRLRVLSDTATTLVADTKEEIVTNLHNLEPTIRAIADVGGDLAQALGYVTTFPYTQNLIDRAVRGDFMNLYAVIDLTVPRLKRTLFLGTRWGEEGAKLIPAPGDPEWMQYSYTPLQLGVTETPTNASNQVPASERTSPPEGAAVSGPVLPVAPRRESSTPTAAGQPIFAGPYPVEASSMPNGGG
ncbi:mammalian cell entry protein [Mycolicibacterium novocastrense]|uniref:MCE family protein n=1 Tax=Mycobacteriaceae TaxID=1762 RepID=UPI0007461ABB|nr:MULTISPECIES: MCE family protein [Mycobacteriaceae]KUH67677.1 mammalian cell entry protein [Mycolicibacterium novocastrense]KUH75946.1 mammalian cell entry protein [Mycolicibacterium novocastrense]KUH78735.1 mammalian cell entry protein [Mycolicibacterium novocastrense]KUI34852.1 mammalian cell entry protein [Mycobacterium sp. IS-1590]